MESRVHVLVIPYPIQGHLNPMLQFSKRLACKGVKVTLLTISYGEYLRDKQAGSVTVQTIADDQEEKNRSMKDHLIKFPDLLSRKLPEIVAEQRNHGYPVSCLVYDALLTRVLEIAKQLGLLGASFFTQSCAVGTIYCSIHEGKLLIPVEGPSVLLPGLPPLLICDLPSFVSDLEHYYPGALEMVTGQFSNVEKADWIFFNTFNSLEIEVLNWLAKKWPIKPVGPTIPSMFLDKRLEDDKDYDLSLLKPNSDACLKWLDSKKPCSVVYISFGSLLALGEDQMAELAWGLQRSDTCFLWVVRESEIKKLPNNFVEETIEMGLVVTWSPQLEVLAHKSVGSFLTHCGWNSILEALSLGVPMVAMPQWSDQPTNAKFVTDVWQVGVKVKADEYGIVTKEEIERCVREVMEAEKGNEIRKNSEKWKKLACMALDEGGDSDKNIEEFVTKLVCNANS
ncbi:hypothetical protein P3X46_034671 [Hevea brasiliensis]|uniref:Glycosyltransferase N-terminal domain-containing protein n=2 Tax=Hevea brasiliensis TaxID=3981 RepID=A0ABQ9KAE8_HEVBR|nr:hypothetical protein P3X46_034671 [Hevea brasiliensis]